MKKLILTALFLSFSLSACYDRENPTTAQPIIREQQPALSETYAAFRKTQINDVSYSLAVDISSEGENFSGRSTINFELAAANHSPVTVDFKNGQVSQVLVNGKAVSFEYNNYYISVAAQAFDPGGNQMVIDYTHPYGRTGSGLHRFKDPEDGEFYLFTDFEPYDANALFPHFDQPNLKAYYQLSVVAPAHWQVISNTLEQSVTQSADGQTRRWQFPRSAKFSSYIFALHAGPFHKWEDQAGDIPLRLFARKSLAKYVKTDDWFNFSKQSFQFFNNYFAIKYPFKKYDQVIVPEFNSGAMENVAAVTFAESYVSRGEKTNAERLGLAEVIAHEMAHMWFGNLVTMDWWSGLWLNESFATYMAYLAVEGGSDFDRVWDNFYLEYKLWAYDDDQLVTTHAVELPVPTTADAFTNFDGITYGKGAAILKQLGHYLGHDKFRTGVRNYLKKHAYQNTTLDDFVSALAEAAQVDLQQWQQQWLFETGLNTIEVDYQCDNNKITQFAVLQTAPQQWPVLRQQHIQLGLYRLDGAANMQQIQLSSVTYEGAKTAVPELLGQQCPDFVYPNVDGWGYLLVKLDQRSWASLQQHINTIADPSLRMQLWQNVWQGFYNADIALPQYLGFISTNLAQEHDKNVIQLVAGHLNYAYNYLLLLEHQTTMAPSLIATLKAQVEQFAWLQLNTAPAASDLQKLWLRVLINVAHSDEQLAKVAQLLNGQLSIEGLQLDQDQRWGLHLSLNRYAYKNYRELLAAEIKRDPSAKGKKMAIWAEALRPDPSVKQQWFNQVVSDLTTKGQAEYKLSELRFAMYGLSAAEQRSFLQANQSSIYATLQQLNASADAQTLEDFASLLLPANCNEASVAAIQQALESFEDYDPMIVKSYKIGLQQDQRCLAIAHKMQTES